ncbi:MAG: hypothetical protein QM763_00770 [Agriterribacter sp.]
MADTNQPHTSYTRRQFLKTSGMAAAMTTSFVTFLHNAFGQDIDNTFFNENMFITGIYPDPAHAGTPGIHLRWMFPLDYGFPDSFTLKRRIHDPSKENSFITITIENIKEYFEKDLIGETRQFNPGKEIEFIRIELGAYGPWVAKAYLYDRIKFIVPAVPKDGLGYIEIQGSAFNRIELPEEAVNNIKKIVFVYKGDSCADKGQWTGIRLNRLPTDDNELENYFAGYYNTFLPKSTKREEAIKRYKANINNYNRLKEWYRVLNAPQNMIYNAGNNTQLDAIKERHKKWVTYQQSLLMCLPDPNIARILGLYYVDITAEQGKLYDYRIKATYSSKKINTEICATVYALGKYYDPLPVLIKEHASFNASQNRDGNFVFDKKSFLNYEQHGSVTLNWNKPPYTLKTNPFCFFLEKNPQSQITIREKEPKVKNIWQINGRTGAVITPGNTAENDKKFSAFDAGIVVQKEKYTQHYQLSGIDLFGRISEPIQAQTEIKDLSFPSPPVGLKIRQTKTGDKLQSYLHFYYGPQQYLKSPDAQLFSLYKKQYSLSETLEIKCLFAFSGLAESEPGVWNSKHFTVTIDGDIQIRNAGGSIINNDIIVNDGLPYTSLRLTKGENKVRLAASKRKQFRIEKIFSGGKSFLISVDSEMLQEMNGSDAIDTCFGVLQSNHHLKEFWTKLNIETPYIKPQEWKLRSAASDTGSTTLLFAKVLSATQRNMPLFDEVGISSQNRIVTELKIDRQLFKSGILNNHIISSSDNISIVAQASPDLLLVEGDRSNLVGSAIKIRNNNSADNTSKLVNIKFTGIGNSVTNPGKLMLKALTTQIDDHGEPIRDATGNPVQIESWITLDLLSDVQQTAAETYETLCMLPDNADSILTSNHYAYFFQEHVLDISPVINTPILPDQNIASGFFALTTTDSSDQKNEGSLSANVQHLNTITVKPPQVNPVYLCGRNSSNIEPAYVSLPNKEGRSTLCLQWDEPTGGAYPPYTYELSRALDLTILSVAKGKWMAGDNSFINNAAIVEILQQAAEHVKSGVPLGNLSLNAQTGLYEATFPEDLFTENEMKTCSGCRIKISSYYLMATGFNGNKIFFRLLNPGENPVNGITNTVPVDFDHLADWEITGIPGNMENLKKLADTCPEAFSLVTKVPVRQTQFLDDLPGQGNGKFFYKVRAVDRAGNKSEDWSNCSMPFYQVDTTIPDKIEQLEVERADNKFFLRWPSDNSISINSYKIYAQQQNNLIPITELFKYPQANQFQLTNLPIRIKNGAINLRSEKPLPANISQNDSPGIIGVYKLNENNTPDFNINYIVKAHTVLNNNIITGINPLLEDETELVITVLNQKIIPLTTNKSKGTQLKVLSQNLQLGYPFSINQVLGVYDAAEFDFAKTPITSQTAANLFTGSVTYNIEKKIITNLPADLNGKTAVVIINGEMPVALLGTTDNSLKNINGSITINSDFIDSTSKLLAIFKKSEYQQSVFPENQKAYNYALNNISTLSNGKLSNLIIPINSNEIFVVKIKHSNGTEEMISSYLGFYEHIIETNQEEANINKIYKISAVKEIPSNSFTGLIRIELEK